MRCSSRHPLYPPPAQELESFIIGFSWELCRATHRLRSRRPGPTRHSFIHWLAGSVCVCTYSSVGRALLVRAAFQNGNSPKSSLNGSHNQSGNFITQQHSSEYKDRFPVPSLVRYQWGCCLFSSSSSVASSPLSSSSGGSNKNINNNSTIFNQSHGPLSPIYGDTGGSPISPNRRVNARFM